MTTTQADELAGLDATAQADLVRRGDVAPTALVEAAIARIERLDPALNAVVTRTFERALDEARRPPPGSPFPGVPFLAKDLAAEVAGVRFTEGSRFLRDNVSSFDQEIATRWRRAGLALVGKANTCEFGMTPTCEPLLHGATRNPWDLTRITGGSSGGSAAAVVAGLVPMAHANDVGGSIRIPASCCGVFGLKPTRARNPFGPEYGEVLGGLAVEHAVTRSVRDSAALLDATSGPDLGDPYPAPAPARGFLAEAGADPGRLRVAFSGLPAGGHAADPECLEALDDAARLLEGLGHHVFERHLDVLTDEVGAAIGTIYSGFTAWVLEYWIAKLGRSPADDEIEPLTRLYWDLGKGVSAAQYLLARDVLFAFSRRVARLFADVDVWLTPTLAQPPLALGAIDAGVDPHLAMDRIGDFVAFPLIVANVTGAPAMSVPLHWTAGGLPVGVHFMARFGDEATLFRLASQLEAARPWAARRPSIGQD